MAAPHLDQKSPLLQGDRRMKDTEFYAEAIKAGFKPQQAEFLTNFVSRFPHEHTSDQISDFEDAVIETIEEAEEAEE